MENQTLNTDEIIKNAKNTTEKTLLVNVQEMASILGETAAEMEIVISSLINEVEKLRARVKELEQKNE
ncbi:MAG: hypothetical protein SOZ83_05460 [Sphaerochaetaceae bacterium]|nr:hypothetical protein [Sphaerochaetaceae bacterium]MDY5967937.1 hypothetical protein [Sphaerochaetaceae bacterium]